MNCRLSSRSCSAIGAAFLLGAILQSSLPAADAPVPIIFDTDMGNDVDDALALAMLHALQSRAECQLLAVTVSKDNRLAAAFVDAVNRFYGRGEIPVGLVHSGATTDTGKFLSLAERREGKRLRYPNRYANGSGPPEATEVLRRALEHATDNSVVIVQVGFSTNLARLLNSPPDDISPLNGKELVKRKVRLLSIMAGCFAAGKDKQDPPLLEYNVVKDVAAAQHLVQEWPTPIIVSGFEIGIAIEFPAESIERDFGYVPHHPIAEAYQLYMPPPHNRPTWDLTSVIQAVRPNREYFGMGPPGRVLVSDDGRTDFEPDDTGSHHFLTVTPQQVIRAREAFVELSSQPPAQIGTQDSASE
jgi:inosine-uridine nucleoside N-ribohydrolase